MPTYDASVRTYLQKLTRDELLAEIESSEQFGARLAAERNPPAIHAIQVLNNKARLAIAYQVLAGE